MVQITQTIKGCFKYFGFFGTGQPELTMTLVFRDYERRKYSKRREKMQRLLIKSTVNSPHSVTAAEVNLSRCSIGSWKVYDVVIPLCHFIRISSMSSFNVTCAPSQGLLH